MGNPILIAFICMGKSIRIIWVKDLGSLLNKILHRQNFLNLSYYRMVLISSTHFIGLPEATQYTYKNGPAFRWLADGGPILCAVCVTVWKSACPFREQVVRG